MTTKTPPSTLAEAERMLGQAYLNGEPDVIQDALDAYWALRSKRPKLEKRIPGVYGSFNRHRDSVQIRVDPCRKLEGPRGGHYLPCEACGTIYEVDYNVVSFECIACHTVDDERVEELFEQLQADNREAHEADDVDDAKWDMMMFHYGATEIMFGHYDRNAWDQLVDWGLLREPEGNVNRAWNVAELRTELGWATYRRMRGDPPRGGGYSTDCATATGIYDR